MTRTPRVHPPRQWAGATDGLRTTLTVVLTLIALQGFAISFAAAQETIDEPQAFGLDYVPRDALAVAAMRPAELLTRPAIAPFAVAIRENLLYALRFPVAPEELVEVHFFFVPSSRSGVSTGMKFHTSSPEAADKVAAEIDSVL